MARTITEAEVLSWTGLTARRLGDLIQSGRLPPAVGGEWSVEDVMPRLCALLRAGVAGSPKEIELVRRIAAQRALLEIQLDKAKGAVVDASDVLRQFERSAAAVRKKLLGAPERFNLPRDPFIEILKELASESNEG